MKQRARLCVMPEMKRYPYHRPSREGGNPARHSFMCQKRDPRLRGDDEFGGKLRLGWNDEVAG
jgi:hypothetical protein